ncbi:MAG TPA: alcohol dehydrogenase catalytic domain-containing protein [Candidatus Limnocylindrales bacterium]|nr:alcohol dehydrogenase catalytic domain-containing protein [Candidatus Limnocylindrales bacterium]
MKQIVLQAPGHLEIVEAADPRPGPRDVVLRVHAALTCGTDLKAYRRGHPKMPPPTPFGHEYAGVVVDAGREVQGFRVGDAVMAVNSGPCGRCFFCQRDQENLCESLMDEMVLGAYAEYLLVPERVLRRNAFAKPEQLTFEQAALLEPLSSVCFGLTFVPQNKIRDEATVVILGAGPIAMLWLRVLQSHGAARVVVAGRRSARLATAAAMGALATIGEGEDLAGRVQELTSGRGADAVIECTGMPQMWELAPTLARRGGTAVLFGGCARGTIATFDTYRLHYDGVHIASPFHFRPRDVAEARRLLCSPSLDWSPLISGRAALADVPELFTHLGDGGEMKIAIAPHGAASAQATR